MNRMQLDMQSMPQRTTSGPTMAALTASANAPAGASPSPLSSAGPVHLARSGSSGAGAADGADGGEAGAGLEERPAREGSSQSSMATLQVRRGLGVEEGGEMMIKVVGEEAMEVGEEEEETRAVSCTGLHLAHGKVVQAGHPSCVASVTNWACLC